MDLHLVTSKHEKTAETVSGCGWTAAVSNKTGGEDDICSHREEKKNREDVGRRGAAASDGWISPGTPASE